MTKRISAKHPIWTILERYQVKMLNQVQVKAKQDALAEMIAMGSTRPDLVAAKAADIRDKVDFLRKLRITLNAASDLLDGYRVRNVQDGADGKVQELQALNPAIEVLGEEERETIKARYADWATAEKERISTLFDAIQIKISLDDAVDEVLKVLTEAGIKLPDITDVRSLPLALDETIPVAGDTKVTVNSHADVYTD